MQGVTIELVRELVALEHVDEAIQLIEPTLARSDAAILDAARSRDGIMHAVGQVEDLYALLSFCCLKQATPDIAAALVAAAAGSARLLADAVALDAVRLEDINDATIRARIEAAWERRTLLRSRLNSDVANEQASSRNVPGEHEHLQGELRQATDTYVALCREHGLIRRPEPLSVAEIVAAVPEGGALALPVMISTAAFVFVVTEGDADNLTVIHLPGLDRRNFDAYFSEVIAAAREGDYLTETLSWLWQRLLGPVHHYLRNTAKLRPGASVVVMPPGLLGWLPLHAARSGPDGQHFCDHWTVSYAPSVRTLLTCRERALRYRDKPTRLLAVIDPRGDLPGAAEEVPMLVQRFASAQRVLLPGPTATLAAGTSRICRMLPVSTPPRMASTTRGSRHDRVCCWQLARS